MHPLEVLADPVRRDILRTLGHGEAPAGVIVDAIGGAHGISQPAVSRHLAVLREHGFATQRAEGRRRLYRLDPTGLDDAQDALDALRPGAAGIGQALDALHTEVARGTRARRTAPPTTTAQEAS